MTTEHHADTTRPPQVSDREMRLVLRIATAVKRDLGLDDDTVEFDDLVQFGCVGLLEARQRFDDARGIDFRWFAHPRIEGAIFDGLRKMSRLPRTAHRLLRQAALAQDDDIQFGERLDVALNAGRLVDASGFLIARSPYPAEPSPVQLSPEELVLRKLRVERVGMVVEELGEPDREIVRRRLFEGHSIAQIASDLDLSRPWTWRVFERACRNIVLAMDA